MEKILKSRTYCGYHVIIVVGKVFKAKTDERAAEILKTVRKK